MGPKIGRANRCRGYADSCMYSVSDFFFLVPLFLVEEKESKKAEGNKDFFPKA